MVAKRTGAPIILAAAIALLLAACAPAPPAAPAVSSIDTDLLEVSVPQLQAFYASRKYTVTQVVEWHLARMRAYNGVYKAVETVFDTEARARAAALDAEAAGGGARGPLWGVPIVIKANTSISGQVTTAGWAGFTIPGHELIAPKDALVVAKLRAAGAVILGHTNMPDFANSDTNRSTSFGRTGNAYDVRFSPGGSSGGTVTAVTANFAVLGNGTDTGNSIRMPAATSGLVGVFPTRGLVSIAGIAPLDWLLDNTGPIARTAEDAAIALAVMAGEDPLDARTAGSAATAPKTPPSQWLAAGALKGKRFAVPAFVLAGDGIPFHGIPVDARPAEFERLRTAANMPLRPETREMFLKAVETLRAAGAEVVLDPAILPVDFARTASRVSTYAYMKDGTNQFLAAFGPAAYHSADDYARVVGRPLFTSSIGTEDNFRLMGGVRLDQKVLATDPDAERRYHAPRRETLAAYLAPLDREKLDGYVYPAIQMPPPDESMPQDGRLSEGPHSATSWVNMIGVPAVVVPAGFYASGLPFGLEFSMRPWQDAELLGVAGAWEAVMPKRVPPVLVERGLLATTPARPR